MIEQIREIKDYLDKDQNPLDGPEGAAYVYITKFDEKGNITSQGKYALSEINEEKLETHVASVLQAAIVKQEKATSKLSAAVDALADKIKNIRF